MPDTNTIVLYLAFALGVASMVLHFVAPKTKNTTDDKIAEVIDEAIGFLPKPTDKPKV